MRLLQQVVAYPDISIPSVLRRQDGEMYSFSAENPPFFTSGEEYVDASGSIPPKFWRGNAFIIWRASSIVHTTYIEDRRIVFRVAQHIKAAELPLPGR